VLVLGLESSCDETAAALVDEAGRVHAEVVHSQVRVHEPYGGVVPELASRDHMRNVGPVIRAALARGGVELADVDGVAVTNRPGLIGALLVGVETAKGLAWAAGKPLVGVDHLMGHLLAVFLQREGCDWVPPTFPFVCLLASGGHTAIYRVDAPSVDAVVELGATRDDAAGEAFDKVAKLLGLGYPGGPAVERTAVGGDAARVKLLAPMARSGSLEMSFSGIKTQVARLVAQEGVPATARLVAQEGVPATEPSLRDLCASFQAAVTGVLVSKTIDAAVGQGVDTVVLGGGVAANGELRRRMVEGGAARGLRVLVPAMASCTDNGAMVAYAGALRLGRGERDGWDLVAHNRTSLARVTRKGRGRR
jgi:N6-L-threonylcarbamoyladenine synthase